MISARVPSPIWMGRFTRTALAALLVSLAVTPHAFAQQELTFSLFERYIDALRVQANIPGMSAANRSRRAGYVDSGIRATPTSSTRSLHAPTRLTTSPV
jgi:hypothetical protein